MRKVTAFLLLMIMAVSAIRPVIAMHYCMGELRSFNVYQNHESTLAEETACCQSGIDEKKSPIAQPLLVDHRNDCCDDTLLEISTDDFQANKSVSISRIIPTLVVDGLFHKTSLINQPIPETSDPPSGMEFPPEGLFLKDIDILSYICIYRI